MKKIIIILFLFLINQQLNAEIPYYINFKYILNESKAGKKAQETLKSKLSKGIANIKVKEKNLQDEEKKIISQKKF